MEPSGSAPVLSDGRVRLRPHRSEDIPAIVEQCNDPAMVRLTTVPRPYAAPQAAWFVDHLAAAWRGPAAGMTRGWAIETEDESGWRFAGSVDFRVHPDWPVADIGYGLHPRARGRGVAQAAARLALTWVLDHGIETVHWQAIRGNWASRRVAWQLGFAIEGTVRDLHTTPGHVDDAWLGSLRRGEPMRPRHPWHVPPRITLDERHELRPWADDDRGLEPDGPLQRFMAGAVPPTDDVGFERWLRGTRERMASGEACMWAVAERGSGRAVGEVRLLRMGHPTISGSGTLAYWLAPEARGRGLMVRSVAAVLDHAFAPEADGGLGLHRVDAGAAVDNPASQAVQRRLGFRMWPGYRRYLAMPDGTFADEVLGEMLAADWRAQA